MRKKISQQRLRAIFEKHFLELSKKWRHQYWDGETGEIVEYLLEYKEFAEMGYEEVEDWLEQILSNGQALKTIMVARKVCRGIDYWRMEATPDIATYYSLQETDTNTWVG